MSEPTFHLPSNDELAAFCASQWSTVSECMRYFRDSFVAVDPERAAVYEPRRIQVPGGYHALSVLTGGLLASTTESVLCDLGVRPPDITVAAIHASLAVIEARVPVYYVDEQFIRAVAATELPGDLRVDELKWPLPVVVLGFPVRFMQEYLGVDVCYVNCAQIKAGAHDYKLVKNITFDVPKDKVVFQFHAYRRGNVENFVAAYRSEDLLSEAYNHFPYVDYTGATDTEKAKDSELVNKTAALVLKLFLILGTRPAFLRQGSISRPAKYKHGKLQYRELWSPSTIGAGFCPKNESTPTGTHASPKLHWRRGHITHQAVGSKDENFVSAASLPRTPTGEFDWAAVAPEVRERFWTQHKRLWLEPVIINAEVA